MRSRVEHPRSAFRSFDSLKRSVVELSASRSTCRRTTWGRGGDGERERLLSPGPRKRERSGSDPRSVGRPRPRVRGRRTRRRDRTRGRIGPNAFTLSWKQTVQPVLPLPRQSRRVLPVRRNQVGRICGSQRIPRPPHARRPDRLVGRRSPAEAEKGRSDHERTIRARSQNRKKCLGLCNSPRTGAWTDHFHGDLR